MSLTDTKVRNAKASAKPYKPRQSISRPMLAPRLRPALNEPGEAR
jgi:hypothetical protein